MFIVSKIFGLVTQPLIWVIFLLVVGLLVLRRKPALGRKLVTSALGILLLLGWQAPPEILIHQLESQYAEVPPEADLQGYVGVVVLGGATESGRVTQAHRQPLLNDAAERLTAPVAMLRYNPQLRVVYTGGEGLLGGTGPSEAERARQFFESMGLSEKQVTYESVSRTTFENAVLTAKLPTVDIQQRWLLVTSAWHMPRSMATFSKAGWNVTAYPVDFRTGRDIPWTDYGLSEGVLKWQLVLHELLGIAAYKITGRL